MARFRNEWKYLCGDGDRAMLEQRLGAVLIPDAYKGETGEYTVQSLYFDDIFDSCVRDNESGANLRYKYRIRYYRNRPEDIHLERKEKVYGRCRKFSCPLTLDEYDMILNGDAAELFWQTENAVLKQFCLDAMNRQFTPKALIYYDRSAFVEPAVNVRVTFDRNISVSAESAAFLSGVYHKIPMQEQNLCVLEVKFDDILPGYIKQVIESMRFQQITFSKYYLGRKCLEGVYR